MRRLATVFSIALIGVIAIWYANTHESEEYYGQTQMSIVRQQALDGVLAEDLSLTTSLFIDQLENQLLRWSEHDFTNQELYEKFQEELIDHNHFEAFALVNDGKIEFSAGEIHQKDFQKLVHEFNDIKSSDPYVKEGTEYMLVSCSTNNQKEVVGEVDLSFVKQFVRDLGNVVDANGNLFIGADEVKVELEKGETQRKELQKTSLS